MAKLASSFGFLAFLILTACARPDTEPTFRSFDLEVTHPSPYSTFLSVAPGARGERLPRLSQLNSKAFNAYLRDLTGCSVDQDGETFVVGHKKAPAGYLVPIVCVN